MTTTCRCGQPTAGAHLCPRCTKTLKWALVNIGVYWADLPTVAAKQTRYTTTGTVKSSVGKTQPLPVDIRFLGTRPGDAPGTELRWDTWNTVVAWCRTVMEELPEQPVPAGPICDVCIHPSCLTIRTATRRRWPRNTVPAMVAYLARQFTHVTAQHWVLVMLDEFLDLEHRLTRMVNRPADRWYAGRCRVLLPPLDDEGSDVECDAELYATVDRGTITCPACGIEHQVADRREFLLKEAKNELVTATTAASALLAWTDYDGGETRLVDRIRKWRDRGLLDVADVTSLSGRDRHLYRLGDIQDLLVRHAQREQSRRLAGSA